MDVENSEVEELRRQLMSSLEVTRRERAEFTKKIDALESVRDSLHKKNEELLETLRVLRIEREEAEKRAARQARDIAELQKLLDAKCAAYNELWDLCEKTKIVERKGGEKDAELDAAHTKIRKLRRKLAAAQEEGANLAASMVRALSDQATYLQRVIAEMEEKEAMLLASRDPAGLLNGVRNVRKQREELL